MSSAVDLRLQYAAVALAEELNFARAADKLHITQSALTKQIRELESVVSVSLFERDKRHVALLRAGEAFVAEAKLAILHSERAAYAAKSCTEIDHKSLTIGRSPYVMIELVNQLFSTELPLFPNLTIQLESGFSPNLARAVINGSIDLAVGIGVPEQRGLTCVRLRRDPLYVVLPPSHPAADKENIFLRDLGPCVWALFARNLNPWIYDALLTVIQEERLQPKRLLSITTPYEGVALVEDHDATSFTCHGSVGQLASNDVVVRPLTDPLLQFDTCLIMGSANTSKLTESFARTYLKLLARRRPFQGELFLNNYQRAS